MSIAICFWFSWPRYSQHAVLKFEIGLKYKTKVFKRKLTLKETWKSFEYETLCSNVSKWIYSAIFTILLRCNWKMLILKLYADFCTLLDFLFTFVRVFTSSTLMTIIELRQSLNFLLERSFAICVSKTCSYVALLSGTIFIVEARNNLTLSIATSLFHCCYTTKIMAKVLFHTLSNPITSVFYNKLDLSHQQITIAQPPTLPRTQYVYRQTGLFRHQRKWQNQLFLLF